jgi:putative (di)nucleoside polyphosphate hydrolase
MIDARGYRLNVGIVLAGPENKLFWGRRLGRREMWQFPQGGLHPYETVLEAMHRELAEEVGLTAKDVEVMAVTKNWLYYQLPPYLQRYRDTRLCVGQKQKWFLLKLLTDPQNIRFDSTDTPEFNEWRWVDYWYPLKHVVDFKRQVYQKVLFDFQSLLKV